MENDADKILTGTKFAFNLTSENVKELEKLTNQIKIVMNMTTKKYLGIAALALVACGGVSIATYALNSGEKEDKNFTEMFTQNEQSVKAASAISNVQPVDLTQAADVSVHAVVHIKATQRSRTQTVQEMPDIFDFFSVLV